MYCTASSRKQSEAARHLHFASKNAVYWLGGVEEKDNQMWSGHWRRRWRCMLTPAGHSFSNPATQGGSERSGGNPRHSSALPPPVWSRMDSYFASRNKLFWLSCCCCCFLGKSQLRDERMPGGGWLPGEPIQSVVSHLFSLFVVMSSALVSFLFCCLFNYFFFCPESNEEGRKEGRTDR